MLWRARKSLVKAFEPSSWAAAAVGPKMSRPRARNRSTTPFTSGASGPTMVSCTFCAAKSASCSMASTSMATFSHLASVAVPALPGATKTFSTRLSCATFQARACSRPPLPITNTFIVTILRWAGGWRLDEGAALSSSLQPPAAVQLVPKMAHAGEHHGDPGFVSGIDHFLVAHRTTRLDHRGNTDLGGVVDAVAEREEGVRGHHRAGHLQTRVFG